MRKKTHQSNNEGRGEECNNSESLLLIVSVGCFPYGTLPVLPNTCYPRHTYSPAKTPPTYYCPQAKPDCNNTQYEISHARGAALQTAQSQRLHYITTTTTRCCCYCCCCGTCAYRRRRFSPQLSEVARDHPRHVRRNTREGLKEDRRSCNVPPPRIRSVSSCGPSVRRVEHREHLPKVNG